MRRQSLHLLILSLLWTTIAGQVGRCDEPPAWATAYKKGPMTVEETRAFMKVLAKFVYDNHLRKDDAAMRGMIYEYFDVAKKGQYDQFVQGEALDTMHDGAWFAAAMVNAYRATGDPFYKEILTKWQLPFYCKALNDSDTLFTATKSDARQKAHVFDKEHALQPGEKGFVPYWWDDGGSVSLERRREKNPLGSFPCTDLLAGKENPKFLLKGYSHGSSNHMAQDLSVMLQLSWLLLRESKDEAEQKLAQEVALAAKNLQTSRMRHHGHIPMVDAAAALANNDAPLMKFVPDQARPQNWDPDNHYYRALYSFKPGQRYSFPGFADDQQYRYYIGLAKHADQIPKALAFRTVYDAFTEPMLFRYYSDDGEVPPGINRFDLHPYYCKDGRPEDYRSDRKGPGGKARPIGSRMGPQNMICCGWALQILKQYPGIWEEPYQKNFAQDVRLLLLNTPAGLKLQSQEKQQGAVLENTTLFFHGNWAGLTLAGNCKGTSVEFKLFSEPDEKGSHVRIAVSQDKTMRATNEKSEGVHLEGFVAPGKDGFEFALIVPSMNNPAYRGKGWGNSVEHGRLSVRLGKDMRNLYMASPENFVKAWLEHELAGGLRTWEAIFKEKGYIPTGIGASAEWDRFSDSGGYAHLISACSQWLFCLEGKQDWQMHRAPKLQR